MGSAPSEQRRIFPYNPVMNSLKALMGGESIAQGKKRRKF